MDSTGCDFGHNVVFLVLVKLTILDVTRATAWLCCYCVFNCAQERRSCRLTNHDNSSVHLTCRIPRYIVATLGLPARMLRK